MKTKRATHIIILCFLVSFLCFMASGNRARADIGEKPSVIITIENPPSEDYYIALLSGKNIYSPLPDEKPESYNPGEMTIEEYLDSFEYNGLHWFESPVGLNVLPANGNHTYGFGYMLPWNFRVILILEDGSVRISDACRQKEYNAEITYDYSTGSLVEHRGKTILSRILMILACYAGTLILEGLMLILFRFPLTKKNLMFFLIINTLTNIPLNIFLSTISTTLGRAMLAVIPEIVICLVEGVYYYFTLEDRDGNRHLARSFLYGVFGNIFSVILGIIIGMGLFYLYVAIYSRIK